MRVAHFDCFSGISGDMTLAALFDPGVPTPATAELLKGVPLRASLVKTELTTPTGAAILTSVVTEFLDTPLLAIEQIGHGAGSKDFLEQPNLLRILVGRAEGRQVPVDA